MSFPGNKDDKKFVFHKGSYKSQCTYMLMLIKQRSPKEWIQLKEEFTTIKDDETFAFFEKLVALYKGSKTVSVKKKAVESVTKKEVKKPGKKVAKKTVKKTVKKTEKKKVSKKAVKKVSKKKVAKKVAKKVTKKATVSKKTAKKSVKKSNRKKVV